MALAEASLGAPTRTTYLPTFLNLSVECQFTKGCKIANNWRLFIVFSTTHLKEYLALEDLIN